MKSLNKVLLVSATVAALSVVAQTTPQYQRVADDGIAASPRLRQFLNENGERMVKDMPATAASPVGYQAMSEDNIAASPRLREFLNDGRIMSDTPSTPALHEDSYRSTDESGVTASPRLREQLNERRAPLMGAPGEHRE